MPYIAAKCPKCAGDLKLDDKLERGYCVHCGTPVYFKDDVQRIKVVGSIKIANVPELDSLIKLIKKDLESGRNRAREFRNRLKRALELNPSNEYLYNLHISQIWNVKIENRTLYKHYGNIQKFIVPDCISYIEKHAFKKCISLNEIIIPKSVIFIAGNIFHNELNITIKAYSNSEAAQYAMASLSGLHLIDAPKDIQNNIHSLKGFLREMLLFKNDAYKQVDYHFTQYIKKSKRNFIIFSTTILPVLIILIIISNMNNFNKFILACFVMFFEFIVYSHTFKSQKNFGIQMLNRSIKDDFDRESNRILHAADIKDYKYQRKIIDCDLFFLEYDINKIKTAKNKLFKINISDIIKNYVWKTY